MREIQSRFHLLLMTTWPALSLLLLVFKVVIFVVCVHSVGSTSLGPGNFQLYFVRLVWVLDVVPFRRQETLQQLGLDANTISAISGSEGGTGGRTCSTDSVDAHSAFGSSTSILHLKSPCLFFP